MKRVLNSCWLFEEISSSPIFKGTQRFFPGFLKKKNSSDAGSP